MVERQTKMDIIEIIKGFFVDTSTPTISENDKLNEEVEKLETRAGVLKDRAEIIERKEKALKSIKESKEKIAKGGFQWSLGKVGIGLVVLVVLVLVVVGKGC